MSDAFQSWLERVPAFNGLLGAYVAAPQQPPRVRSWSEDCGSGAIQSLHRQVGDVVEVLEAVQLPARRLRWIFGRTVVYFERHKNGAAMCLITTHDPWVGESELINNLIADFRTAL